MVLHSCWRLLCAHALLLVPAGAWLCRLSLGIWISGGRTVSDTPTSLRPLSPPLARPLCAQVPFLRSGEVQPGDWLADLAAAVPALEIMQPPGTGEGDTAAVPLLPAMLEGLAYIYAHHCGDTAGGGAQGDGQQAVALLLPLLSHPAPSVQQACLSQIEAVLDRDGGGGSAGAAALEGHSSAGDGLQASLLQLLLSKVSIVSWPSFE